MRISRLFGIVVSSTALLATMVPTSAQGAAPRCFGKRPTIVGTEGRDTLRGTSGPA